MLYDPPVTRIAIYLRLKRAGVEMRKGKRGRRLRDREKNWRDGLEK